MARIQHRPDIIRLVIAVASEPLFNEINIAVLDEADIEIVGIVKQVDDLLATVKVTFPHVVLVQSDIADKWDEYVKQVSDYSSKLEGEPLPHPDYGNPVEYAKWQHESVQQSMKGMSIAVLLTDDSSELMTKGMLAGARFFLPLPLEKKQLISTIVTLASHYPPIRIHNR